MLEEIKLGARFNGVRGSNAMEQGWLHRLINNKDFNKSWIYLSTVYLKNA